MQFIFFVRRSRVFADCYVIWTPSWCDFCRKSIFQVILQKNVYPSNQVCSTNMSYPTFLKTASLYICEPKHCGPILGRIPPNLTYNKGISQQRQTCQNTTALTKTVKTFLVFNYSFHKPTILLKLIHFITKTFMVQ